MWIAAGGVGGDGVIEANGGNGGINGDTGGGGGGRIAVWRITDNWTGTNLVTNIVVAAGTGTGQPGVDGTVFLGQNQLPAPQGTLIVIR